MASLFPKHRGARPIATKIKNQVNVLYPMPRQIRQKRQQMQSRYTPKRAYDHPERGEPPNMHLEAYTRLE
jgi:hypothetical protein